MLLSFPMVSGFLSILPRVLSSAVAGTVWLQNISNVSDPAQRIQQMNIEDPNVRQRVIAIARELVLLSDFDSYTLCLRHMGFTEVEAENLAFVFTEMRPFVSDDYQKSLGSYPGVFAVYQDMVDRLNAYAVIAEKQQQASNKEYLAVLTFLDGSIRTVALTDVEIFKTALLATAVKAGDQRAAEKFIMMGVAVNGAITIGDNEFLGTPLAIALYNKRWDMALFLCRSGADVDLALTADGGTLLYFYAGHNDLTAVKFIISELGADVNVLYKGMSALAVVLDRNNFPMAEMLVKLGADVNVLLPGGNPLLMLFASMQRSEQVRFLIAHGADVNGVSDDVVLLQRVLESGYFEMAKLLVELGANVNYRISKIGITLLMFFVNSRNCPVVEFLMKNGADASAATQGGVTAMTLAKRNNDRDMQKLLTLGTVVKQETYKKVAVTAGVGEQLVQHGIFTDKSEEIKVTYGPTPDPTPTPPSLSF